MDLNPSVGAVTFESLISLKCSVGYSVTARIAVLRAVGGYDERLHRAEDFDLWLRIAKAGGCFRYHKRPLLRYRRRSGSLSSSGIAMAEAGIAVLEKVERDLALSTAEQAAVTRTKGRFRADLAYLTARAALHSGDVASAIAKFRELAGYRKTLRNTLRIGLLRFAPRLAVTFAARRYK
jgi:hypothetical protein